MGLWLVWSQVFGAPVLGPSFVFVWYGVNALWELCLVLWYGLWAWWNLPRPRRRRKKKRTGSRKHRNRYQRFHRRALPYHLVMRCERRDKNWVWQLCHHSPSSRKFREMRRRRRNIRSRIRYKQKRRQQRKSKLRALRATELREAEREAECERVRAFEEMDETEANVEFFSGAASLDEFLDSEPEQNMKTALAGFDAEVLDAFVKDVDFLSPISLMNDYFEQDHSKNVPELLDRVENIRLNAFRHRMSNTQCQSCNDTKLDHKLVPLILGSGASFGLTPFKKDFIHTRRLMFL